MIKIFFDSKIMDSVTTKKTIKHRTSLFLSIALILSNLIWPKAYAWEIVENNKRNKSKSVIYLDNKSILTRSVLKKLNKWIGFLKNCSKILNTRKRIKVISLNKHTHNLKNLLKKTYKSHSKKKNLVLGNIIGKISETDKIKIKTSKSILGEIVLYHVQLLELKKISFFDKSNFKFKNFSLNFESVSIMSRKNPESQSSSALMHIYPEIKEFNLHDKNILLDIPRGIVETNFSEKSGCKLSTNLKLNHLTTGFYSKKKLFCCQKYNNQTIYNLFKKYSKRKNNNRKFKLNKYRLINKFFIKKKILKSNLSKKKNKRRLKKKKFLTINSFKKTAAKKMSDYSFKLREERNSVSTNKCLSLLGIRRNFSTGQLNLKRYISFFLKKKKKNLRIKFGKKKSKSALDLCDLTIFPFFSFNSPKRKKRFFYKSTVLNSFSNFSLNTMNNFKKRLIYHTELKKNIRVNIKKNFNRKKFNSNKISYKPVFSSELLISNYISKIIRSVKLFFYLHRKYNNFLLSNSRKFIYLNDFGGLNFIAKSFSNGIYIPKSLIESYKMYKKSSFLGNSDADFNLSEMYYYGKGVERNKKKFFIFLNSCSNKEDIPSLFNMLVCLKKVFHKDSNCVRYSEQIKKLTRINFIKKKNLKIANKKQKTARSSVLFSNIRQLTEVSLIKSLVYSLVTPSHNLLFGFIQEKQNFVSLAIKNFKKNCINNSFSSGLRTGELLLEIDQIFMSIELLKDYRTFNSSWKDFYFISRVLLANGFLPDYSFKFIPFTKKSEEHSELFRKTLVFVAFFYSSINILLFLVKFFISIRIINLIIS